MQTKIHHIAENFVLYSMSVFSMNSPSALHLELLFETRRPAWKIQEMSSKTSYKMKREKIEHLYHTNNRCYPHSGIAIMRWMSHGTQRDSTAAIHHCFYQGKHLHIVKRCNEHKLGRSSSKLTLDYLHHHFSRFSSRPNLCLCYLALSLHEQQHLDCFQSQFQLHLLNHFLK